MATVARSSPCVPPISSVEAGPASEGASFQDRFASTTSSRPATEWPMVFRMASPASQNHNIIKNHYSRSPDFDVYSPLPTVAGMIRIYQIGKALHPRHVFRISRASRPQVDNVFLVLEQDGVMGYG